MLIKNEIYNYLKYTKMHNKKRDNEKLLVGEINTFAANDL